MILTEQTTVAPSALPLAEFREHLRLGSGLPDAGLQDAVLETALRAALAAIEARTGKVLIARDFLWAIEEWRGTDEQALPVAPVTAVSGVTLIDIDGNPTPVDPAAWRLVPDTHRPRLISTGAALPAIAFAGMAEIAFTAGFGPDWAAVPADLQRAVLLLAARYYDFRSEGGAEGGGPAAIPFGVLALIERWRTVRLLGGRGGAA
jgi:uncharacterized phiE125 gp8 family phage protein